MSNDDRLIEIMAELLAQSYAQTEELRGMRQDLGSLRQDVNALQREQSKTNLAIGELRLSVMRLADKVEQIGELDKRLRIVENIVLRSAS